MIQQDLPILYMKLVKDIRDIWQYDPDLQGLNAFIEDTVGQAKGLMHLRDLLTAGSNEACEATVTCETAYAIVEQSDTPKVRLELKETNGRARTNDKTNPPTDIRTLVKDVIRKQGSLTAVEIANDIINQGTGVLRSTVLSLVSNMRKQKQIYRTDDQRPYRYVLKTEEKSDVTIISLEERIYDFLSKHRNASSADDIAFKLSADTLKVANVLTKSEWFSNVGNNKFVIARK
tara:strand:+ start:3348 stop:4043 length:696 start_codon:yes stop_codon:yes gene_type:complete